MKESVDGFDGGGGFGPCRAFPNYCHPPAGRSEGSNIPRIPLTISAQLVFPELLITRWQTEVSAVFVCVPETPMNKHDGVVFSNDKIGAPWQTRRMEAEPNSTAEEALPQYKFRLGIFSADPAHHSGADFRLHDVSHSSSTSTS